MKIKTQDLIGPALDWAVAKCEGRALRDAVNATDEEAAQRQVPFPMFDVEYVDGTWVAQEIVVTRFGCAPGCSLPSITAFREGIPFNATVGMYFWTREEAELDCLTSNDGGLEGFEPSVDWSQGGPIIEREFISVSQNMDGDWHATKWVGRLISERHIGTLAAPSKHLVAAMRCFVAMKLGDEIELPQELL